MIDKNKQANKTFTAPPPITTVYTKDRLFLASLKERYVLNKPGSTKQTYHISLDLQGSGIQYRPGDVIAIMPSNHPDQVQKLLSHINHDPQSPVIDPKSKKILALHDFLATKVNLNRAPKKLLEHLHIDGAFPDLLSCLQTHGVYNGQLETFCAHLAPMLPRFYSIASSMTASPTTVDLLVSTFTHLIGDREMPGVGSDYLCHQIDENTPIPLYHQPTKHFLLPPDDTTPIIMVGPGTGVAPYRAFLQERQHTSHRNWLLFGERHEKYDFYYDAFFKELQAEGKLVLDTAFSRDQDQKCYVQHRLLENKERLWQWLEGGAILYICGDAKRMAKDVLKVLETVICEYSSDPTGYTKALRKEKRLLLDVY